MTQTDALRLFDPAVYKYAHQWMRYPSVAAEYELEDLAQPSPHNYITAPSYAKAN